MAGLRGLGWDLVCIAVFGAHCLEHRHGNRRLRHRRPVFVRRHDMYTRNGMRGLEASSHLSGQMIQSTSSSYSDIAFCNLVPKRVIVESYALNDVYKYAFLVGK
jgi:hypothetical protein